MVAALIVIVVIAVGLPFLAWWVGGRRFWGRLQPAPVRFAPAELRARHRLTVLELIEVQRAAGAGQALDDPRLRAAAVDWSGHNLARLERSRKLPEILMAAGAVLLLALVTIMAVTDRWSWHPVFTLLLCVNLIVQGFIQRRLRSDLRRAVELNTDQDDVSRWNGSGGQVRPGRADS